MPRHHLSIILAKAFIVSALAFGLTVNATTPSQKVAAKPTVGRKSAPVVKTVSAPKNTSPKKSNTYQPSPVVPPAVPAQPLQPKAQSLEEELANTQTERDKLQILLSDLKREIATSQNNKEKLEGMLKAREIEFNATEERLKSISQRIQANRQKLDEINAQANNAQKNLLDHQDLLSTTLSQTWYLVAGNHHVLGGRPIASPGLFYLINLSGDQAKQLNELQSQQNIIQTQRTLSETEKKNLSEEAKRILEAKLKIEKERIDTQRNLAQANLELKNKQENILRASQDETRLGNLVALLSKKIEQRNRLIAKQQADEALRRRQEIERLQKQATANNKTPVKNTPPPEPIPIAPSISALGRFSLPVQGTVTQKFAERRIEGGLPSRGLFIRTNKNSPVQAIGDGRVVFSGNLKGFGNLIIIDHGGQTLSIYGNNQALIKAEGASIKGGETIATTGMTGNYGETGLYFELRKDGRAVDPLRQ
ncbi:murein hydrolase activator EnvC family protein [Ampullimonas aquatilis]|uniref:murein hydrolase activator EnvC family protein n=1 Tax=Ampullimonas aquatilis TaxID=1341549 RepID=UPI003C71BE0C